MSRPGCTEFGLCPGGNQARGETVGGQVIGGAAQGLLNAALQKLGAVLQVAGEHALLPTEALPPILTNPASEGDLLSVSQPGETIMALNVVVSLACVLTAWYAI